MWACGLETVQDQVLPAALCNRPGSLAASLLGRHIAVLKTGKPDANQAAAMLTSPIRAGPNTAGYHLATGAQGTMDLHDLLPKCVRQYVPSSTRRTRRVS